MSELKKKILKFFLKTSLIFFLLIQIPFQIHFELTWFNNSRLWSVCWSVYLFGLILHSICEFYFESLALRPLLWLIVFPSASVSFQHWSVIIITIMVVAVMTDHQDYSLKYRVILDHLYRKSLMTLSYIVLMSYITAIVCVTLEIFDLRDFQWLYNDKIIVTFKLNYYYYCYIVVIIYLLFHLANFSWQLWPSL